MKVLFVCFDHYPYNGACTSLLEKIFHSGNMKNEIEEIHVLTVKCKYDECDTEQINGITVHRCFPLSILTKKDILDLIYRRPILAMRAALIKMCPIVKAKLFGKKTIEKKHYKNEFVKKLKQLDSESYDVVIPVYGCYETGEAIIKHFEHSTTKTVIYQVDPCAGNLSFSNKLHTQAVSLEKSLFEAASAIITTPILFSEICENYSESVIKKAYSMEFPNVDSSPSNNCYSSDLGYNCLYAGSIYSVARNPKYTVQLFNLIKNPSVKLHFVGSTQNQIYEYVDRSAVGEHFKFHGRLSLDETRKEIDKAAVLVNIGNIMTNQVPSKIFEYISTCKPIINICTNSNCPSITYLEKYPLSLSLVEGVGTLQENAEMIENFILTNAGKTVEKELVLERFKECTAGFCAEKMVKIFNTVI